MAAMTAQSERVYVLHAHFQLPYDLQTKFRTCLYIMLQLMNVLRARMHMGRGYLTVQGPRSLWCLQVQ